MLADWLQKSNLLLNVNCETDYVERSYSAGGIRNEYKMDVIDVNLLQYSVRIW